MAFGQSFQERNASFEHMYKPSRAKALFKRHKEITDKFDRDMVRMKWETKNVINELTKDISIAEKRGAVLYKKVRSIEDKHFDKLSNLAAEESVFEDEPLDIIPEVVKKRRSAMKKRASLASLEPEVIEHEVKSPSEAKISFSEDLQRPVTVHEGIQRQEPKEHKRPHTSVHFQLPEPRERDDHHRKRDSLLSRRSRRQSVFALTKARQFELRNMRFKDENEMFKEELQEQIYEFYDKVDIFKKEYLKSLEPRSQELPEIKDSDVTNKEDSSGEKFKKDLTIKTVNPFAQHRNAASPLPLSPMPPGNDSAKLLSPRTEHGPRREVHSPVPPKSGFKSAIQRTMGTSPNILGHSNQSREELMKERVKMLYLESDRETPERPEVEEIAAIRPQLKQRKSELHVDLTPVRQAFDEFMTGRKTTDDMMRLVTAAAKLKHNARKRRDKSFIPFISARKAVAAWKSYATRRALERQEATKEDVMNRESNLT